jgi:hypothetical protein
MAFAKIDQTPDGNNGSTYINVDHITEVVFDGSTNRTVRGRVRYIGGGVTTFDEGVVEELKAIIDPPQEEGKSIF